MSVEGEEEKHDPNSTRLLERVANKLDQVLSAHGMSFRGDDEQFQDMCEELRDLVYQYYTDEDGGDDDYEPGDSLLSVESDTAEGSISLSSEEDV